MSEKHLKKCSKSLVIRELQVKTTLWLHLTPIRLTKIKTSDDSTCWQGCGERTFLHCLWDCKVLQSLCKSIWRFLKKLEIDLSENPTIPLLGIHPKDAPPCRRGICSTMFIAALFVIARSWKKAIRPKAEEWIQNIWFIYTMKYYTAINNEDMLSFSDKWMELENIILSEVPQIQKDIYGMYSLISGY